MVGAWLVSIRHFLCFLASMCLCISTREDSLQQLHQPHELLVLPERFLKIRDVMMHERADAHTLAELIQTDVAIAATMLKIANSAAYNPYQKPLSSLSKAIARLGLATSAQIAMSMSLYHGIRLPVALQHMRYFWAHSFAVSQICALMGSCLGDDAPCHQHDLFMMGLLHDVGCILMAIHLDPRYFERDILDQHGAELCALERRMYGLDHAEVGAILLQDWRCSGDFIQAVVHHHDDDSDSLSAHLCSHADQWVHEYWPHVQSIEGVQELVAAVALDDVRQWLGQSEVLLPWLKA